MKITQIGNKVLRRKTQKIDDPTSARTKKLITTMMQVMHDNDLVGIAAPQVGVGLQLFITEIRKTKHRKTISAQSGLTVYINPKITKRSKKQTVLTEGCGSLAHAGLFGPVKRPAEVTVTAQDAQGRRFTRPAKGLLAKVIQHEFDHLQGTLILDKFLDTKKVSDKDELPN